ncbi:hypothetical protein ACTRXD_08715 [Nitrospira sp. T9]|uniref:hypothetical protein n=1 Tax=unclassified Nitrospira TaxID=2652172 RepID=UPI003F9C9ABD
MLYFRTQPDAVFIPFVRQALDYELQSVRRVASHNDTDAWLVEYPAVGILFTPYSALITLEELLVAHEASMVYRLTDYHWLLLYGSLKNYCLWHNDQVHDESVSFTVLGGYRFGPVDFETMTDWYFWDHEFMELLYADADESDCCLCGDHTDRSDIDLSYGLRPHPDKLKLIPVEEPAWRIPEPEECGQWRLP